MVHEWWGHNDYARMRAAKLASMGYAALAVDMYGDGKKTTHPKEAGAFASAAMSDFKTSKGRFEAALAFMKEQAAVDDSKIAAIGYCFGGSTVLAMAEAGVQLAGVVSFHGGLKYPTPSEPQAIKAKILVCNGEADSMITAEHIGDFKSRMSAANADMEFQSYPGAKHSFTNPAADQVAKQYDLPLGYDASADAKSWQQMQDFFNRIF